MPEIKLTIDGIDYEMEDAKQQMEINHPPLISFNGVLYKTKEKDIPKQDSWGILAFIWNETSWKLKDEVYFNANMSIATLGFLLEQVSFGKATIHSVKRLHDQKTFTVKDITNYGTIEKFYIGNTGGMNVHFTDGNGATLNSIEHKPKVALFTTEDGVEIFEGDEFVLVTESLKMYQGQPAHLNSGKYPTTKYFSTEEKAKEYILLNKSIEITMKEFLVSWHHDFIMFEKLGKIFFQEKINP